jgi:uncharacterized protein (TIGR02452 family)
MDELIRDIDRRENCEIVEQNNAYCIGTPIFPVNSNICRFVDNRSDFEHNTHQYFNRSGVIRLVSTTTTDCVRRYCDGFQDINILNFANARHPGGGYINGSCAQEEDLCRKIPNLYQTLMKASRRGIYPLHYKVLYSEGLTLLRNEDNSWDTRITPINLNVVTAAAPCRASRHNHYDGSFYSDGDNWNRMIRAIMTAAGRKQSQRDRNRRSVIVLGAIGCGAFGNYPNVVANKMYDVLVREGYCKLFDQVYIAIPLGANYDAFNSRFV